MKRLLVILAVLAIFLVSCKGGTEGPQVETPFAGGVEGLSMSFVRGAPPDEVFDNEGFPFSISVLIENLGEYTVPSENGYVEITGINPADFDDSGVSEALDLKQNLEEEIDGVVKNFQGTILLGDKIDVSFDGLNYIPDLSGNFNTKIRANLCYNYETKATTYLCVKKDLLSNIGTAEICDISGDKIVFNSGAPIQITAVEQNPAGSDKLQVLFTLSHVGYSEDRFYKLDTDCDDYAGNTDKDLVLFEVVSQLEGVEAECSGLRDSQSSNSGYVELPNGADTQVVCSFDVSSADSIYETPINLKLGYRYSQYIEKPMLIKDVSVGDDE